MGTVVDPRTCSAPWAVLTAALAALAAFAVALPPPAAAAKPAKSAGNLYVLNAAEGELNRVGDSKRVFELMLGDPAGDVTVFTDRPTRKAGHQKLRPFVRSWNQLGFRRVPPNAALVIADAPSSRDVLVVELTRPRLLDDGVAFRAKVVKGSATDALRRFRKRADRRVADEFGQISLFIDPSGQPAQLVFRLSNIPPGELFVVTFSNTTTAQGSFPTVVTADGPVNSLFALNAVTFASTGSVAVSGSAQTGVEVAAGATRITGTVQSLPSGSSATAQVFTGSNTGPVQPLAFGRLSIPLP